MINQLIIRVLVEEVIGIDYSRKVVEFQFFEVKSVLVVEEVCIIESCFIYKLEGLCDQEVRKDYEIDFLVDFVGFFVGELEIYIFEIFCVVNGVCLQCIKLVWFDVR